LLRIVGESDVAADLLQHVWLKALQHLGEGHEQVNVRAWLYRVGTNAAFDWLAYRKRWRGRLEAWGADPERRICDPPPAPLSDRTRAQVREALAELPSKQREAVWFRWVEGLGYSGIAEKLRCSPASARANVYQGLKRLRRSLADLVEEA